jgi:hypothetical protein
MVRGDRSRTEQAARLAAIVERCEASVAAVETVRTDGDALADAVGGTLELRWRIACLRAVMAAPPDADAVREAYGELVDRFRDDAAAMAELRKLGDDIHRREVEGTLPRVMVVRSSRRPTSR